MGELFDQLFSDAQAGMERDPAHGVDHAAWEALQARDVGQQGDIVRECFVEGLHIYTGQEDPLDGHPWGGPPEEIDEDFKAMDHLLDNEPLPTEDHLTLQPYSTFRGPIEELLILMLTDRLRQDPETRQTSSD